MGARAEAAFNDVVVTTSEAIQVAEGYLGLQAENGHIEWRALKVREVPGK